MGIYAKLCGHDKRYSSYRGGVGKIAENILQRDFKANGSLQKAGTDVTEFKCEWGKAYLSPVIDFYNDADEVHQVVSGEGQGQCKGTHQYDNLEYVHLEGVEYLHQDGEEYEEGGHQGQRVFVDPLLVFRCHERAVLQSLDQHEVDDAGGGKTSEDADAVFHVLFVVEGKHDTCQPLYQHTEEEGYGYGDKDGHDDGQSFVCIDQVAQS